jgi:hypothetical protein
MESALIVVVLSSVMVIAGRLLMLNDRRARFEGFLSCVLGASLVMTWYTYRGSDFDELADFLSRRAHQMLAVSTDDSLPLALVALVPAAIALMLLLIVNRPARPPAPVRNIFGTIDRIRRPRILR